MESVVSCPASKSLPKGDLQGFLFESLGSIAADLFDQKDKYKLFARKVWPLLAGCREELAQCYEPENGRPGIEPVVLLGVLIFQFMERVPDREAVEMVKYHLGWKLALNLKLGADGFHPTTLVHFRTARIHNDAAFDAKAAGGMDDRSRVCSPLKNSSRNLAAHC